eukprot:TRINITY_DN231_c0_g1_i1.p1 TRINITY_DN231_c0_g1~~TRINITY_DN231_c0_g1_i1.p1  ORF type:complete len:582 (+),score=119.29 TRINITY_DN231_c0_g1_i1:79-1824(+)
MAAAQTRRESATEHCGYVQRCDPDHRRWSNVWVQSDGTSLSCYSTGSKMSRLVTRPLQFAEVSVFYTSCGLDNGGEPPAWFCFAFELSDAAQLECPDSCSRAASANASFGSREAVSAPGNVTRSPSGETGWARRLHLFRLCNRRDHGRWVSFLRRVPALAAAEAAAARLPPIASDPAIAPLLSAAQSGRKAAPAHELGHPRLSHPLPEPRCPASARGPLQSRPPQFQALSGATRARPYSPAVTRCSTDAGCPPGHLASGHPVPRSSGGAAGRRRCAPDAAPPRLRAADHPQWPQQVSRAHPPLEGPPRRGYSGSPAGGPRLAMGSPSRPPSLACPSHAPSSSPAGSRAQNSASAERARTPTPSAAELIQRQRELERLGRERAAAEAALQEERQQLQERQRGLDAKEAELLQRQTQVDDEVRGKRLELERQFDTERREWHQAMQREVESRWAELERRLQHERERHERETEQARQTISELTRQLQERSPAQGSRDPDLVSSSPDSGWTPPPRQPPAARSSPDREAAADGESAAGDSKATPCARGPQCPSPAVRSYVREALADGRQDDLANLDEALEDILMQAQ